MPNVRTEEVTVVKKTSQTQEIQYTVYEQHQEQVPYECTYIVYKSEPRVGTKKVVFLLAGTNREDLVHMTKLYEAGEVVPVVDRVYPLSEAAEAFRLIGEGRSRGKVVITV